MAPQSLFFGVGFDDLNVVRIPAREFEIPNCFAVNREDGAGLTRIQATYWRALHDR